MKKVMKTMTGMVVAPNSDDFLADAENSCSLITMFILWRLVQACGERDAMPTAGRSPDEAGGGPAV